MIMATVLLVTYGQANAQSGSTSGRPSGKAHHDLLWSWLKRHNYTQWTMPPSYGDDFQPGQSPHGALVKTYLNSKAAQSSGQMAYGSVVVKENYSPDKKLMAVTIMQRSEGYDPEHGDWYYAKYMPNGQIAKAPPEMKRMPIAGKVQMCIQCHSGADGDDFVFFND